MRAKNTYRSALSSLALEDRGQMRLDVVKSWYVLVEHHGNTGVHLPMQA